MLTYVKPDRRRYPNPCVLWVMIFRDRWGLVTETPVTAWYLAWLRDSGFNVPDEQERLAA